MNKTEPIVEFQTKAGKIWQDVLDQTKAALERAENDIMIQKEIIMLCEAKVAEEKAKLKK